MSDLNGRVRELLSRAKRTASLHAMDPTRTASMMLEHTEFRELLLELAQYQAGYEQELQTLISLVSELQGATMAATNGSLAWVTELPPGKAPLFRAALNKLLKHLRDAR